MAAAGNGLGTAGTATVLLVDDDDRVREVIRLHIAKGGYAVREAPDGAAGLAVLEAEAVDVVLCDIRMRGISGVDVLKKVRELHPTVPVIMLTGFVEAEQASEVLKLGAFDYLTKPVQRKDLLGSIAKAVEWRRLVQRIARLEAEGRERQRELERRVEERVREVLGDVVRAVELADGGGGTALPVLRRALAEMDVEVDEGPPERAPGGGGDEGGAHAPQKCVRAGRPIG